MLTKPEHYKGIFYIRISALPTEEKFRIRESFDKSRIVKILKENSLINDCILYPDYVAWFKSANIHLAENYVEALLKSEEIIPARVR
jgi:hypothetical protein